MTFKKVFTESEKAKIYEERQQFNERYFAPEPTMSTAEPVSVTVKPLEWEYAARPTMTYMAFEANGEVLYYIDQSFGSDSYYFDTIRWPETTIYYGDDLPAAKAAAQADYETRVLSALSHVQAPAEKGAVDNMIDFILSDETPVGPEDQPNIDMFNRAIADAKVRLAAKPIAFVSDAALAILKNHSSGPIAAAKDKTETQPHALYASPTPQVDEAMVERDKLLRHFVSMFKSGAQGCEMDWEGAQALALAIEAAIGGAKP